MGDDQVMVLGCECAERVAHKFEAGLHTLNEAIDRSSLDCGAEQRCVACLHEAAISDGPANRTPMDKGRSSLDVIRTACAHLARDSNVKA